MKHKAIYKTVTWRAIATTITILIIFFLTERWDVSVIGGSIELVSKMVAYFMHEKAWGD